MFESDRKKVLDLCRKIIRRATPVINLRGENYWREGRVKDLEIQSTDQVVIKANVQGKSNYEVEIGPRGSLYCTCPYFARNDRVCKHIVAVCYQVIDNIQNAEKDLLEDLVKATEFRLPDPSKERVPLLVLRIEIKREGLHEGKFLIASSMISKNDELYNFTYSPTSSILSKVPPEFRKIFEMIYSQNAHIPDGLLVDYIRDYPFRFYILMNKGFPETGRFSIEDGIEDLELFILEDGNSGELLIPGHVVYLTPYFFKFDSNTGTLKRLNADDKIALILQKIKQAGKIKNPSEIREFLESHGVKVKSRKVIKKYRPVPVLKVVEKNNAIHRADIYFRYGRHEVISKYRCDFIEDGESFIKRNREEERKISRKISRILDDHNIFVWSDLRRLQVRGIELFLNEILPELQKIGVEVLFGIKAIKYTSSYGINFSVKSVDDWFELETEISDGDVNLNEIDRKIFLKLLGNDIRWIKLTDGTLVINDGVDEKILDLFRSLGFSVKKKLKKYELLSLREYDQIRLDELSRRIISVIKDFKDLKEVPLPPLKFPLRGYQKEGYYWLNFLLENEFGGILADDMGLGKTVQVIALIARDRSSKPYLVVAPTTVTNNWKLEVEKFSPDITAKVLRSGKDINNADFKDGVFIVSYNLLQRHIEKFRDIDFRFVILDEAQAIKNPLSKRARAVKELKADLRLALTGTPIENSLVELWSIFDFLMPGFLGDFKSFKKRYLDNSSSLESLRKKIAPFVLRRTKESVLKELPPKVEQVVFLDMKGKQRRLYNKILLAVRRDMEESREMLSEEQFRFKVLTYLLRLRQVCLYPKLLNESFTDESIKLETFREMVREIVDSGHRVLVFSQFVKMLKVLEDEVRKLSIPYLYLDGSTKNRQEIIDRFDTGDYPVFLLSLKAGGVGINLTKADYVIIYDPWWNPAVEMQATDRTHRIGQDKTVFVYKFIIKDSVEEKILKLQERKRELAANVITEDQSILKKLTPEEIEKIFSV